MCSSEEYDEKGQLTRQTMAYTHFIGATRDGDSVRTYRRTLSYSFEGNGSEPVLTMHETDMGTSMFEIQSHDDSDGRLTRHERTGVNAFSDPIHSKETLSRHRASRKRLVSRGVRTGVDMNNVA